MKKTLLFFIILTFVLAGCNLNASTGNGNGEDAVSTSVAATLMAKSIEETVAASQSQAQNTTATQIPTTNSAVPTLAPTATQLPTNTIVPTATTIPPTNTPLPTATTSIACNVAGFIADITVPDGTVFEPNQAFTKTWRLRNNGSCAWTTSYKLVFSHGDQMSGAGEVPLPITVPPGQSVDVSINLVSPAADGVYRGDYKLMDSGGNLFALSNGATFYVEIETKNPLVIAPLIPPVQVFKPTQFNPTQVITANPNGVSAGGVFIVGDFSANLGYNAFMKFDLSAVPDGSTITGARIEFPLFNVDGDPFGDLECLRAYIGAFFPISTADVIFEPMGAVGRACSLGEMGSFTLNANYVNNQFATSDFLELKFQFNRFPTDNDNTDDKITAVGAAGATLILEYDLP